MHFLNNKEIILYNIVTNFVSVGSVSTKINLLILKHPKIKLNLSELTLLMQKHQFFDQNKLIRQDDGFQV